MAGPGQSDRHDRRRREPRASIKRADIGVGMGITGTDVTKNVADMVLADDNFATIVSAVEEGRRIYDNIRKAIQFLLSSNLSEVISIFFATMVGFIILKPVHILWINLITDTFPALALSFEAPADDVMDRPPRPKNEGIFAGGLGSDAVYQGIIVSVLTVFSYLLGHYIEAGRWEFVNSPDGMTMAFLTMSLAEVFHSFNMRSQRGSVLRLKTHNKYLYLAMAVSLVLTLAVSTCPSCAMPLVLSTSAFRVYLLPAAGCLDGAHCGNRQVLPAQVLKAQLILADKRGCGVAAAPFMMWPA